MSTLQRSLTKLVKKSTTTAQNFFTMRSSRQFTTTSRQQLPTTTTRHYSTGSYQQQKKQYQSPRHNYHNKSNNNNFLSHSTTRPTAATTTSPRRHFTSQTTPNPAADGQPAAVPAQPKAPTAATTTPSSAPSSTPSQQQPAQATKTKRTAPKQTIETRANYLDRRDNIHSYEKGQFQVATGKKLDEKNLNWLYYLISIGFASLGMTFVAVPLYQAFCQMTGSGGQIRRDQQIDELNRYMQRTQDMGDVTLRPIQVTFQSTVDVNLDWSFYPCQKDITLRIGETALAFFRARNNGKKPVIGVSTYNVLPPQAGLYFNKIQCFCFDEQRLRAGEEIDMPVFFFLDPAMADDWRMDNVSQVTLCYTFFEVQEDEVEEAVRGLNEVRSQHKERIAASPLGQQAQPSEPQRIDDSTTVVNNGDGTKTFTTTLTMHVPNQIIQTNNTNSHHGGDDDDALICPIIPPSAMHNPSGISLVQSQLPRIVTDAEAKANESKATTTM